MPGGGGAGARQRVQVRERPAAGPADDRSRRGRARDQRPALEEAYDIAAVMEGFDFVNLMSYDFHGYWDDGRWDHRNFTGHNSPLITRKEENDPNHPGYK